MKLKRQTAKKLASLSAIGSGILVAGATEAQASVIIFDVTPNVNVGLTPGAASSFSTTRASHGGVGFGMFAIGCSCSTGGIQRLLGLGGGSASVMFAVQPSSFTPQLALFNAGQTMGAADRSFGGLIAGRSWGYTRTGGCSSSSCGSSSNSVRFHSVFGSPTVSHKYALFTFILNSDLHYGWIDLSVDNPDVFGSGFGPMVTIHRWAISDVANAMVLAGTDTEQLSDVPEPSSFALTGLGALALGAAGVRRWRAAKKAA